MKTKLLTLLLAVAASIGTMFAGNEVQIGDLYYYLLTNHRVEVTSPNSGEYSGDIVIPASVTYKSVTYSVTSIGSYAFRYCTGLTSVTIPNSVTTIGKEAFYHCTGLTSVTIPNSVTIIENMAFRECTGLTSPVYNAHVFAYMPTSFSGAYTIPDGIESIAGNAFWNCIGLTSVTIPNSVTSIGNFAFSSCTGLTYVEAPAVFFDILEDDWSYYTKILTHVVVNGGELSGKALLFINRSYKTLQTLDVSGVTNTEFTDEAFKGCYNLQQLVLPAGLTHISYNSVAECIKLNSVVIPAGVTEIDDRAFEDCRSLGSVNFAGDALRRIGNWAFYNCHALENIEIPAGVTEIGAGAFYGCTYLNNLSMPASVQSIGDNCFALCSKISQMNVDAVLPPAVEDKTFYEVSTEAPVYVPDESVTTYKAHPVWGKLNIIGKSDRPQAIENTKANAKTTKILRDGQIFILRGEKVYTLTGQEVK